MFSIEVKRLYWLEDDGKDHPEDLCLHGTVAVQIGSERFEDDCAVSAAALELLKTLSKDHVELYKGQQMLPCCGHCYFEGENDTVWNGGCPNGIDWHVRHIDDSVELETENGTKAIVPIEQYKATVFAFADIIKAYYDSHLPKTPEDVLDIEWYPVFWREWARRRREGHE